MNTETNQLLKASIDIELLSELTKDIEDRLDQFELQQNQLNNDNKDGDINIVEKLYIINNHNSNSSLNINNNNESSIEYIGLDTKKRTINESSSPVTNTISSDSSNSSNSKRLRKNISIESTYLDNNDQDMISNINNNNDNSNRLSSTIGTPGQSLLMKGNQVSSNNEDDITENKIGAKDDSLLSDEDYYANINSLSTKLRKMKHQINNVLTNLIDEEKNINK